MIRLAATYFVFIFAIGFALGVLRVLLLVPSLGARNAELLEIPIMLVAIYFVARWVATKATSQRQAYGVGVLALAMLLTAEVALAAILFGKSPAEALFHKDPLSGTAYYMSLAVFALMPGWLTGNRPLPRSRF